MKWHYRVVNKLDKDESPVLDSSRLEEFDGYDSQEKAFFVGLGRKIENRLPDYYVVETIPTGERTFQSTIDLANFLNHHTTYSESECEILMHNGVTHNKVNGTYTICVDPEKLK